MSKAAIFTANTVEQLVAINGVLSLGSVARRFGCNDCGNPIIDLAGNAITLNDSGYYDVDVSVVVTPTAAGTVTVALYQDGTPVPAALASATVAAAATTVTLPISAIVRVFNNAGFSSLTLVLTGAASTVDAVAVEVTKL